MTAKEYLNQARHLDALINCRLREIDYWRDLSSSISGSNFEPLQSKQADRSSFCPMP